MKKLLMSAALPISVMLLRSPALERWAMLRLRRGPVASIPRWVAALPLPRLRGASVRALARPSVSQPVSPVLWPVRMARP
jgi:hypothetical protein